MTRQMSANGFAHPSRPSVFQAGITADLALLATFAAILLLFLASPITMESWGIPYLSSGGGVFSKLHPATFIAIAALGLRCLATPRPLHTAIRLASDDAGVVLLVIATVTAALIAIGFAKTPFTPLIDTFICPALVFLLLRDLDPRLTRWLAIAVVIVLFANAIIALLEFLRGWRLINIDLPEGVSADPTQANSVFNWQAQFVNEWRATALLGHPLSNGLIIGEFLICLAAVGSSWIPGIVSVPLAILEFGSMFAFGARTALVGAIAFGALLLLQRIVRALDRGARLHPHAIAGGLLLVVVALLGIGLLEQYNFFDKMVDRFSQDAGSATTRITMFELFDTISWTDFMLGPDQDRVATLQRLYGLEFGIESSWLGLVLNYGFIVTMLLVFGLVAFCRSLYRATGEGTLAILAYFFILASVAATLSTKTTTFAITVAMAMLFFPAHPRRMKLAVTPEPRSWP